METHLETKKRRGLYMIMLVETKPEGVIKGEGRRSRNGKNRK
jgi:hypothetical protein